MARTTLARKTKNVFDFDDVSPDHARNEFLRNVATQTVNKVSSVCRVFCFLLILFAATYFLYAAFLMGNEKVQFVCRKLVVSSAYGFGTTVFVWMITYLDSQDPGINPPTPITPTRGKQSYFSHFHFNYVLAIFIGVVVFLITLMDL